MKRSLFRHGALSALLLFFVFAKQPQAHRLDIQVLSSYFELGEESTVRFLPGLGVGYDFRTPADRSGWSIAPFLVLATEIHNLDNSSYDYSRIASLILPSIISRYRYAVTKNFLIDFNLGGGVGIAYNMFIGSLRGDKDPINEHRFVNRSKNLLLAPWLSIAFQYHLPNQMILGLNTIAFYSRGGLAPIIALSLSFPIADNSGKRWNRRK